MMKCSVGTTLKRYAGSKSAAAALPLAQTLSARIRPMRSAARTLLSSRIFLEVCQQRQRFERRDAFDVDRCELVAEPVILDRRMKESELPLRVGRGTAHGRSAASRQLITLERRQNLL